MPNIDCGHWNGRRNRLPHLAASIVWRSRWGRRFRLPMAADFHRSSKSRKRLCTRRPTETCVRGPDVAKLRYDGATYAGNRATGAGRNQKRHFHSVDELIVQGLYAWREKRGLIGSNLFSKAIRCTL